MTPSTSSGQDGDAALLREKMFATLGGWLTDEHQRVRWEHFVDRMGEKDIVKMQGALGKWKSTSPGKSPSLSAYLKWYRTEKEKRSDLLESIPAADAAMKTLKKQLKTSVMLAGDPLPSKDIDRICKTEESLAGYLISLSVVQLETYKEAVRRNDAGLSKKQQDLLLRLFSELQKERFEYEQDWARKVGPLAQGIATAVELQNKITALEAIQAQYASPSSDARS